MDQFRRSKTKRKTAGNESICAFESRCEKELEFVEIFSLVVFHSSLFQFYERTLFY